LRIVFASTVVSVGGGVLTGLALTFALNKVVAKWVEGNSYEPLILLEGTLLLALVSAIACLIPAFRAAHIDPMAALRSE
jgi:ABC-type antimicrobial peptide transport system permease subunit